jgi:Glycosyl transferase family 2
MIKFVFRVFKVCLVVGLLWLTITTFSSQPNRDQPIDVLFEKQQAELLQENENKVERIEEINNDVAMAKLQEQKAEDFVKQADIVAEPKVNIDAEIVHAEPNVVEEKSKVVHEELEIIAKQIEETKPELNPPKLYETFSKPPNIFGNDSVGELGAAVTMPKDMPAEIKKIYDEGRSKHQFNQYVSDLISFKRELPDTRSDYCKNMVSNYSKTLPAASVVFIFHNEAWSTLLRSIHSVLDRSPEYLIEEILLVDDFSDMGSF